MCAMRTQPAKERIVARGDALPHNRDSEARDGGAFWRLCCVQPVTVVGSSLAKFVLLMGGPEVSGKLFDKLRRQIDPVEFFQCRRQLNGSKGRKPFLPLLLGQGSEMVDFPVERLAFHGKFVVVFD